MHSILPRGFLRNKDTEIEDRLSHDITVLALDQPKQLWSVTWDSVVSMISDDRTDRETAPAPHKVGTPPNLSPCNAAHDTCGSCSATNRDVGATLYQGCLLISWWPQQAD